MKKFKRLSVVAVMLLFSVAAVFAQQKPISIFLQPVEQLPEQERLPLRLTIQPVR